MREEEFKKEIFPLKDKLFRFALRILKQREEARDATQDILVKLWKLRTKLQQYNNVEAFAMKSIKNHCLDKLKHEQIKLRTINEWSKEKDVTSHLEGEQKELFEQIEKEIEKLPVQQKMAMHLRDIEGLSYKEIQEILQTDIQTVRMNVSRGRKKIRKELLKIMNYGLQRD